MDSNLLDVFLVVSLCVIAVTSLIFVLYFVPVLIQLAKTLEAAQSLLNTVRNYFGGIGDEFEKIKEIFEGFFSGFGTGLGKTSSGLTEVIVLLKDWIDDFMRDIKR